MSRSKYAYIVLIDGIPAGVFTVKYEMEDFIQGEKTPEIDKAIRFYYNIKVLRVVNNTDFTDITDNYKYER